MTNQFIRKNRNSNIATIQIPALMIQMECSIPNFCPYENIPVQYNQVINTQTFNYNDEHNNACQHIGIVFQCSSCGRFCLIDYQRLRNDKTKIIDYPSLMNSDDFPFPKIIEEKFKNFSKIYKQSSIAENNGLDAICGMGYRRSLEFLVEGFLLYLHKENNEEQEKIKKATLSKNIDRLSKQNQMLRENAKIVSWIGNDQTHTKEKHPDQNIENMKEYLGVLTNYIAFMIKGQEAHEYMNNN